jgi:hypothetical protein
MAYLYSGVLTNCILQFHVSGIMKFTSPFVVLAGMLCATVPIAVGQAVDWA